MAASVTGAFRSPQAEGSGAYQPVRVDRLRVGTRLRIPIYDVRNVLLLAEGAVITRSFLQKLQNRGVETVRVHESELAQMLAFRPQGGARSGLDDRPGAACDFRNAPSEQLDSKVARGAFLGLPFQKAAFKEQLQYHGSAPYLSSNVDRFVEDHGRAVAVVEDVIAALERGKSLGYDAVDLVIEQALGNLAADPDLYTCLAVNPFSDKYPARHGLHVAMLAVAIGARLNLGREALRDLAVGCLVHDAGMLRVDQTTYTSSDVLDRRGFEEVMKHPIHTLAMLEGAPFMSTGSAFVAFQIHERCDGSGYPRARRLNEIHILARIAAVADAYLGLVSPRPHRPGMLPYKALERMIYGVHDGRYDAAVVRALLQCVSLFPVGSFVKLSDGRRAKVIRPNADVFHRPIVEIWTPDDASGLPQVVDLAQDESLSVVRTLAAETPEAAPSPMPAAPVSIRAEAPPDEMDAVQIFQETDSAPDAGPLDATAIADSWE